MAIDSEEKRLSCLDYEGPFPEAMPMPFLGVGAYDRYHLLWAYSGIASSIVYSGIFYIDVRSRFDALDVSGRGHVDVRDRFGNLTVKRND